MKSPRPIELLAPARNADIAIEAIKHGADAVYIGASSHGARSAAANTLDDVERVVRFAHQFRARVYVTLNTLIYESELAEVKSLVETLYKIGVDALIVQDMALLEMDLPPIALHASTQCDIRTVERARFLAACGFSQLVLPREMTLSEMAAVHAAIPDTPLEAFVHGALCVSYSGDCQAGYVLSGRSANRGECPQICRYCFDLEDDDGNKLIRGRHLLSLRDLNRSALIAEMLAAGVSSFKIEGRLKDVAYVKNTVAAYRRLIDSAIAAAPELYCRASAGVTELSFTPDLEESFNRGYTEYFTRSATPAGPLASMLTPKWIGRPVGKVVRCTPRGIKASLSVPLANGDGLGYFDASGRFAGFRVNKVEGNTITPAQPVNLPAGTELYRNNNKLREDVLVADTAKRTLPVSFTLRPVASGIALDAEVPELASLTLTEPIELAPARTDGSEARRRAIAKTGQTIFSVQSITDNLGQSFVPLSIVTSLRRRLLERLTEVIAVTHPFDYHRPTCGDPVWKEAGSLTYHNNVANSLAEKFYREHGVKSISPAVEVEDRLSTDSRVVMTTRYCLRRESGCCLRSKDAKKWPAKLFLVSGPNRFKLEFDCANCRMHLLK